MADGSWWHKETGQTKYNGCLVLIVKFSTPPHPSPFLRWQGHYSAVTTYRRHHPGLMVSLVLVRNVKVVPIISARKRTVICHCAGQCEGIIQQIIKLRAWLTLSGEAEKDAQRPSRLEGMRPFLSLAVFELIGSCTSAVLKLKLGWKGDGGKTKKGKFQPQLTFITA